MLKWYSYHIWRFWLWIGFTKNSKACGSTFMTSMLRVTYGKIILKYSFLVFLYTYDQNKSLLFWSLCMGICTLSLGWSFLFTVLWNTMNHGSHKIFWLFRSKALQKAKKIKNPCRFRVSNLPSKFLKKSLSKMTVFISKMKWHFRISFFSKFSLSY